MILLTLALSALAIDPHAGPQVRTEAVMPEPQVLDDGRAVRKVLKVQPFELTRPYNYEWSAERPAVTRGQIVLLDVDPAFLVPSDTRQAVLYCGALPVERLNSGWPDGRLAVLVPGEVDLAQTPFFFGGYELPEAVTRTDGMARLAIAERNGLRPLTLPTPMPTLRLDERVAIAAIASRLLEKAPN